jgi:hypothetical protein
VSKAALLGILLGALTPVFSQTPAASTAQPQPTAAKVTPINQRRVDPAAMYHRVYAVVPMTGTGKKDDPFRPMFVLSPSQMTVASATAVKHTGILSYQMHVSDDGKFALVEFVGATRADLQPILASTAAGATVFERGNATQAQIETEFKKYKKDFTMSLFNTRAQ